MARVKKSAYKMKGYAYPGTSPVKATSQSVVSQAKTKADASLIWAGEQLGKAYVPGAIDYTIDNTEIKVPKKEKKNKKNDIDDSGADKGSESRSNYNKKKSKKGKKGNKKKNRGGEDTKQYWSDPNVA